jgi:hypothetical protein
MIVLVQPNPSAPYLTKPFKLLRHDPQHVGRDRKADADIATARRNDGRVDAGKPRCDAPEPGRK